MSKNTGPDGPKGGSGMRIVVKVGTSTLAHATGRLNIRRMEHLCKVLSDLKNAGHQIILVSSGAIGMGVGRLGLPGRPADMPSKQAAAAVGQCELMYTYDKLFSEYNHTVAQILLTADDIDDAARHDNFQNTIGENDTLSAIVAAAIGADVLVLLSDIDGLYDKDPRHHPDARLIPTVERVDDDLFTLAEDSSTGLGTGGMVTKLRAAAIATAAGCEMVIANGAAPEVLYDIAEGKPAGTRFLTGRAVK